MAKNSIANMNALFAEFIGTFILVFIGTTTAVLAGSGLLGENGMGLIAIAFAFGFTLMVLVYTIGPISGAHVNPAVTIAMLVGKKISTGKAAMYIAVQVLGGIVASAVLLGILAGIPEYSVSTHGLGANFVPQFMWESSALLLEVVLTGLFVFVIFNATSKKANPAVSGWAIGGYLFVAHLIGVPLGGSSLNPARSIGPALFSLTGEMQHLWIFIVGPIAGALLGYSLYRLVSRK